jgi:oxidase EvaA
VDSSLLPPFTQSVLKSEQNRIRFDTLQSEEGGRFFREENRNLIVEADEQLETNLPPNYIWMTAGQLKKFIQYNNFVNVQARSLLSSLSFTELDRI